MLEISRALGVSHGTVYRHFPTKAALVEAGTERRLAQVIAPLAAIADAPGPALPRMRGWFDALTNTKRQLASDDPARTARAAFHAMSRFHHPLHRPYWTDPGLPEHYDAVWELVAAALAAHRP